MVVAVYRDNRNPSLLQLPNGSVFLQNYLVFAAAEPSWLATSKTIDPKRQNKTLAKNKFTTHPAGHCKVVNSQTQLMSCT